MAHIKIRFFGARLVPLAGAVIFLSIEFNANFISALVVCCLIRWIRFVISDLTDCVDQSQQGYGNSSSTDAGGNCSTTTTGRVATGGGEYFAPRESPC